MGRANPQVHLIHGTDAVRVHQERARLVAEVLPREHRAENLTEIEPPANRVLRLCKIAADLIAELATPSFFRGIPRVVVVEQLGDLFASRPGDKGTAARTRARTSKKKSPDEEAAGAFCRFLERDLPQGENILILVAIEQPEKRRRLNTSSPLCRTIQSLGRVVTFKQPAPVFQLIDAFLARDLASALRALPEVLSQDDGVASAFRMLSRQVRFLIQAKLVERLDRSTDKTAEFAKTYFPPEKGLNLMFEPDFVVNKTRRAASRWSLSELNTLLPRLERLIKVVYPSINDVYVPDPGLELERFLLDACAPTVRARTK